MQRSRSFVVILALVLAVGALSGACANGEPSGVTASGDHDGLTLDVRLRRTGDSLRAETVVRNTRTDAVHLDTTQCGRVAEVILARTVFEPQGETYTGSLEAVKQILLGQQRSNQFSDSFAPRRETGGSDVPECVRPTRPVKIPSGESIAESWELEFSTAYALAEVGSEHMVVKVAAVESVADDKLGFIDIYPAGDADTTRQGRAVTAETPASGVLDRRPTRPNTDPSLGQRFDRMVGTPAIRSFIEAQSAESWREARIIPTGAGPWEFRAVTTDFERALRVDLTSDGTVIGTADVPGPGDRARVFERRTATLPPGIALIPEPDTPTLTEDVIAGRLSLPSGRVVADGTSAGDAKPMTQVAKPGAFPVFVTVGRTPGSTFDTVAFASLVVSDAPTMSWVLGTTVAVDSGTASFSSAEGYERLAGLGVDAFLAAGDVAFDSLTAHDGLITALPTGVGADFALFSTGYGDGGYGVHVGLDANGDPTRYVMDFTIVHLAWPEP